MEHDSDGVERVVSTVVDDPYTGPGHGCGFGMIGEWSAIRPSTTGTMPAQNREGHAT
ncbi:hypothetical protein [Nocardia sp. NPDC049526]|uniref:hypothetical protein n=1 Tax=Nocardia sp. NPDC049526 TaxID=3364316 RepID=UPI003790EAB9